MATYRGADEFIAAVFGDDEEFKKEADIEYQMVRIGALSKRIADASGLSRRAIAQRMGCSSTSAVQRLVGKGATHNATLETLIRFADACGFRMKLAFVPKRAATIPRQLPLPTRSSPVQVLSFERHRKKMESTLDWVADDEWNQLDPDLSMTA